MAASTQLQLQRVRQQAMKNGPRLEGGHRADTGNDATRGSASTSTCTSTGTSTGIRIVVRLRLCFGGVRVTILWRKFTNGHTPEEVAHTAVQRTKMFMVSNLFSFLRT